MFPSVAERPAGRMLPWAALVAAFLAAAGLIWTWGEGQTILGDEWRYAHWVQAGSPLDRGLDPAAGKYGIPVALVLYERLFEWFGIESYAPYRVTTLLVLGAIAALLFVLVRRRLGAAPALAAASLVLVLGAGGEAVAISLRLPGQLALAFGLGALVLLERPTPRREVLGCVLLVASVGSHPLGLAFVAAAAALVVPAPGARRWRRLWIPAVPAALFALVLRPPPLPHPREALLDRIIEIPGFAAQGFAGSVAAITGAFRPPGSEGVDFTSPATWLLAALTAFAIAAGVARARPRTRLVAALICLLVLLAAPTLAPGDRPPNLGRYVFPASVVLLLVLADAGAPWRERLRQLWPLGLAVLAVALTANLAQLHQKADAFARDSMRVRAEIAALEVTRGNAAPDFEPESSDMQRVLGARYRFPLSAAEYREVAAAYGTPALTRPELRSQGEGVRAVFETEVRCARRSSVARVGDCGAVADGGPRDDVR